MENATSRRNADEAEFPSLLQDDHTGQAESGAGSTVEEGVNTTAEGCRKDDAQEQDEKDIPFARQGIQGDDRDQVGQAQLGPRGNKGDGQHAFYNIKD